MTRSRADIEHLAAIVDSSSDAILFVIDGVLSHINPAAEELYGYESGELIGQAPLVLSPPELAAESAALTDRAQGGEALEVDTVRLRRDGTRIDVSLKIFPIRDAGGTVIGTGSIARDVTDRKRDEERSRASEQRFRTLFEAAERAMGSLGAIVDSTHDAIIGTDLDGIVTSWNRAAERIYGYGAEEMLGRPMSSIYEHAEHVEQQRELFEQLVAGQEFVDLELRRAIKNGRELDISVTVSPVRDADGRVVGTSSISRDVTERNTAAAELLKAQETFRLIFDTAPTGMFVANVDGSYVEVNDAFCRIVGRSASELRGMHWRELTHPADFESDHAAMMALVSGDATVLFSEKRYIHSDGREVHAAIRRAVLRDADGRAVKLFGLVEDITELKRQHDQLEYFADHDILTGLLNRRAFNRELEQHAALVERYGAVGSVLVIDLDHFKYVNDTLGHHAGDELIARAASVLRSRLRTTDVLARLGGDEFGVLLPKAGSSVALGRGRKPSPGLREQVLRVSGLSRTVTASIGVASFEDRPGLNADEVLVNADLAMYDAKEEGRDRVARYAASDRIRTRMKHRITWAHRIQSALADERFELVAQPIVDLRTREVSQYELLLRMRDDDGELILPGEFLPIAERLDYHPARSMVGDRRGLSMLAECNGASAGVGLVINLSGHSLGDDGLLGTSRPSCEHGDRSDAAHVRDHRDRGAREHRARARVRAAPAGLRLPLRARRLRHGVRLVRLPETRPLRHDQDRRRVHPSLHDGQDRPTSDRIDRRDRPRAR